MEPVNIYDLKSLFHVRETVEKLEPRGSPHALLIDPCPDTGIKRLGILSGSFNPPTKAHIELAVRARESYRLDRVFFLISRVTIDKEETEGLAPEDRLLLLSRLAGQLGWASAAIANRGLYYEQAVAVRSLIGRQARIFFLVGMDKVAQILDPRYYQDRDQALVTLFIEAQLIAASRGDRDEADLRELLQREENQNYADRVYFLPMPAETGGLASSAIRSAIARGEPVAGQLPEVVARFISEAGAFRPTYETRRRLLERLYALGEWAKERADLRKLVALAGEETERGKRLRAVLDSPVASTELKGFLSAP